MSPNPATDLVSLLEASRQDFLTAIESVSDERAAAKPDPARWSVLEVMEHVVIVEGRFLSWIEEGERLEAPAPDAQKESSLLEMVTDRSTRVQAPPVVHPAGRFTTVAQGRDEFLAVRARSIQTARERTDLYLIRTDNHRRFGPMNGAELMHIVAGHAQRHAAQIREALAS